MSRAVDDPLTNERVKTGGKKLSRNFLCGKRRADLSTDLIRACGYRIDGIGFETTDLNGSEVMAVV